MPLDLFLNMVVLAAAAAFTPGPNNALVASSGATFGFRRTLPHIAGIALGFPVMIFIVGFALGEVFQHSAALRMGLRLGGAALLLWIAWNVWNSGGIGGSGARARPFTFAEAAGFQWINPKGWSFAIALTSQYVSPAAPVVTAGLVAGAFLVMGIGSASLWTLAGRSIARLLGQQGRAAWFNRAMAVLIAGCVVLLFLP